MAILSYMINTTELQKQSGLDFMHKRLCGWNHSARDVAKSMQNIVLIIVAWSSYSSHQLQTIFTECS